MSEFELHKYSGMAYESNQHITFSEKPSIALPDVEDEMKFHAGVSSVQVSNLTQKEFDYFFENYGDDFEIEPAAPGTSLSLPKLLYRIHFFGENKPAILDNISGRM